MWESAFDNKYFRKIQKFKVRERKPKIRKNLIEKKLDIKPSGVCKKRKIGEKK